MKESKKQMVRPLNNEKGLEIMEAGLYAFLIIIGALGAMALIGPQITAAWTAISGAV